MIELISTVSQELLYLDSKGFTLELLDYWWKEVCCNEKQSYAKIPFAYIREGKILFNDSARAWYDELQLKAVEIVLSVHWEMNKQSTFVMLTRSLRTIVDLGAGDIEFSEFKGHANGF
jgi:hypothetical protein